jgi:hypothetical protein
LLYLSFELVSHQGTEFFSRDDDRVASLTVLLNCPICAAQVLYVYSMPGPPPDTYDTQHDDFALQVAAALAQHRGRVQAQQSTLAQHRRWLLQGADQGRRAAPEPTTHLAPPPHELEKLTVILEETAAPRYEELALAAASLTSDAAAEVVHEDSATSQATAATAPPAQAASKPWSRFSFAPSITETAARLQRIPGHSVFEDLYAARKPRAAPETPVAVHARIDPVSADIARRLPEGSWERLLRPRAVPVAQRTEVEIPSPRPFRTATPRSRAFTSRLGCTRTRADDVERIRRERDHALAAQCTFTPRVCAPGEPRPSAGSFVERQREWDEMRDRKAQDLRSAASAREVEGCTFAPHISRRVSTGSTGSSSARGTRAHANRMVAARLLRGELDPSALLERDDGRVSEQAHQEPHGEKVQRQRVLEFARVVLERTHTL